MDNIFPKFKQVSPSLIIKEIREAKGLDIFKGKLLFEIAEEKLRDHGTLTDFETDLLSANYLAIKPELKPFFMSHLDDAASEKSLLRILKLILEKLEPAQIAHRLITGKRQALNLLALKQKNIDAYGSFFSEPNVVVWLNKDPAHLTAQSIFLLNPNDTSKVTLTNGQKNLFLQFFSQSLHFPLFVEHFDLLLAILNATKDSMPEVLVELDKTLAAVVSEQGNSWRGQVLNPRLGFKKLLDLCVNNSYDLTKYKHIQALRKFVNDLLGNLNELSKIVVERGRFWESKLIYCKNIECTRKDSGAYRVGVAFYIGNQVFCEFGPEGNALYVYEALVFEKIKKGNWKQPDLTSQVGPYPGDGGKKGAYFHTGGWQSKYDTLVEYASRAR